MQSLITALVVYGITFCVVFLVQLGRPSRYPDRGVAWFLAANAASDLSTLVVALLIVTGLIRGSISGYLFAASLVVQGAFYTYRVRMGRMMARGKQPKRRRGAMRVKIDPEVIRLTLAVVAGLQLFASTLTGLDVIPTKVLVLITAVCAAVALMCSTYTQGLQSNPPEGMLTEERARELSAPAAIVTDAEPRDWPTAEYTASGRATVGVATRPEGPFGPGA